MPIRRPPLPGRHTFGTNRQKTEENKLWLRKLISRKVLSESNAAEYKAIVEKLGPKLNAFINTTKTRRPNF